MKIHDRNYINGQWVPPKSSRFVEVTNAATEEVIARVPAGAPEDIDPAE